MPRLGIDCRLYSLIPQIIWDWSGLPKKLNWVCLSRFVETPSWKVLQPVVFLHTSLKVNNYSLQMIGLYVKMYTFDFYKRCHRKSECGDLMLRSWCWKLCSDSGDWPGDVVSIQTPNIHLYFKGRVVQTSKNFLLLLQSCTLLCFFVIWWEINDMFNNLSWV